MRPEILLVVLLVLAACQPAAPAAKPGAAAPSAPAAAPPAAGQPAGAPAVAQPPRAPDKIKISNPSTGAASLPLFAARDRGFFERNGIEAETLLLPSDRAMAAVASGEIHYVAGVGTASVAASALGLPIRAAWFSATSPAYTLFARPEIRSVDQLRGKRVGVPGIGGTSAVVTWMALRHYGIDSRTDLVTLAIGSDELLLESLRTGGLDVAPLTAPTSLKARAEGFTPLVDVASLVQMPLGGLSITTDKLTNEREQARRVVRALTQAKEWLLQNREEGVAMLMETLETDRATAEGTYDEVTPTYRGHGLVTREGIDNVLEILRDAGRLGPEVRFEDVAHAQLAEEVARELALIP
jgi:NitT/TauT family transport system substrate-binding protein